MLYLVLSYIGLAYCGYVFSVFTWNRCMAIGKQLPRELPQMDHMVALAFPVFVASIKYLFSI